MRAAETLLGRNLLDFWFGVVLIFLFLLGFTSSFRTLVLVPVRTRGIVTFLQVKEEITFILEGPALLASLTWNRAGPRRTEPNGSGPGFGTNSQAVRYQDQDYEVLKRRLFQDDSFPALGSLGFSELGPRLNWTCWNERSSRPPGPGPGPGPVPVPGPVPGPGPDPVPGPVPGTGPGPGPVPGPVPGTGPGPGPIFLSAAGAFVFILLLILLSVLQVLMSQSEFLVSGASRTDICQGTLGENCSFSRTSRTGRTGSTGNMSQRKTESTETGPEFWFWWENHPPWNGLHH